MPGERKPSWSASFQRQRRSSLSTAAQGGGSTTNNAAFVGGVDNIGDMSKFTKQFHPRTKILSPLPMRDISCTLDLGRAGDTLGIDDDDDEDFMLDNILSCIVNDKKVEKEVPASVLKGSDGMAHLREGDYVDSMKSNHFSEAEAPSNTVETNTNVDGDQNSGLKRRHNATLGLEHAEFLQTDSPLIQSTNPVSDEENDKLSSVRDASGHKRVFVRKCQRPVNSWTGVEREKSVGGSLVRSLLVDSILDDIQLSSNSRGSDICSSDQEPDNLTSLADEVTPPRGRITTQNKKYNTALPNHVSRVAKTEEEVHDTKKHNNLDDDASTITEPTESPFIYTYKRSLDDDSVSQITSSVAGSSHHLRNVPSTFGASSPSPGMQIDRSGLTWMNNNSALMGGGSRIIHRKALYGRDRVRKSNKFSATAVSGIGAWSHEGRGKNSLDEIAYALNADCTSLRSQRGKAIMQPLGKGRSTYFSQHAGDDKSTGLSRHDFADDMKSGVSRLGMGGVSCGAQSISEGTADTETSSTLGFFQNLALLTWNAQHRAGRYFFPKSPAERQRKKFDRSDSLDSLEDILLEEGVKTLPRKRQGFRSHYDDNDDDEIDYFSRAMSTSSNIGFGGSRRSKQNKIVGRSRTTIIGGIFISFTTFSLYRSPAVKKFSRHVIGSFNYILNPATDAAGGDIERQAGNTGANQVGNLNSYGQVGSADADSINYQYHDIRLPQKFEVLVDVDNLQPTDVPFYWHIPRSSGSTVKDVLGVCLHLTLAADAGGSDEQGQSEALKVLHSHKISYVNVDTSTHQGISRAKSLNLISSGLADVVISPLLHESLTLFSSTHKGRMFAIFRHPVERAASLFYTRNDQFAGITIEDFFKRDYGFAENNWITRFLTNDSTEREVDENDLEIAKAVLRQKCLVGLVEEKRETFDRIQKYFNWNPKNDKDYSCLERKTEFAWSMMHDHPLVKEDSQAWRLIVDANKFDMRLYAYIKELFLEQGTQLATER